MTTLLLTGIIFVLVFLGMSIGYLLKGKCLIGGTCGSKAVSTPDGRMVCPSCGAERSPKAHSP